MLVLSKLLNSLSIWAALSLVCSLGQDHGLRKKVFQSKNSHSSRAKEKKKKSLNYSTSLKHFKVSLKIGERDVCQLQRDYPAVAFLVLFYDDATEYSPSGSLINVYE